MDSKTILPPNTWSNPMNLLDKRLMDLRESHVESAIRTRKCHMCRCNIEQKERHLAIYNGSAYHHWAARTNVCFICLESLLRFIKKPMKGAINRRRKEHNAEIVLRSI